jgi:hypothetical protein
MARKPISLKGTDKIAKTEKITTLYWLMMIIADNNNR